MKRRAVSFERPDFHFSEALSAELRLAAQRLLGDQRVRSDRTRVDLVVDQVRQLQHVDVADCDRLFELVAGHAVVQVGLARVGSPDCSSSALISLSREPSNTGDPMNTPSVKVGATASSSSSGMSAMVSASTVSLNNAFSSRRTNSAFVFSASSA